MEKRDIEEIERMIDDDTLMVSEPEKMESLVVKQTIGRKKTNWPAIIFGLMAMMFAGLVVFFGLEYFKVDDKGVVNPGESNEQVGNETDEIVVASDMAKEYEEVKSLVERVATGFTRYSALAVPGDGLVYKPKNFNTHILMRFDLEETIEEPSNQTYVEERLLAEGYEYLGTVPFIGSAGPQIHSYINNDSEIVCNMYEFSEWNSYNGNSAYVKLSCAKTNWHWLSEDEILLANGLAEAYYEETGEYPSVLHNYIGQIDDSGYESYQRIRATIGGGYALFYRSSAEDDWKYFTGGQSPLMCEEYDTDDLKKAFAGYECFNASGETLKVQP